MVKYLDNKKSKNIQKAGGRFGSIIWWMIIFLLAWWLFASWMAPNKERTITDTNVNIPTEDISAVPTSTMDGEKLSANIQGLRISSISLKDYQENDNVNVSLLAGDGNFAEVGFTTTGTMRPTSGTLWKTARMAGAPMMWRNADGIDFIRTITIENYTINITDEIKNNSKRDISVAPYVRMYRGDSGKNMNVYTGAVAMINSDIERESWGALDDKSFAYQTASGFAGFVDQYWETVAEISAPAQTIIMKKIGEKYNADISAAPIQIVAGTATKITTKIFAGPRDPSALGASHIDGLTQTMDYGWFWFLSQPMLWAINAMAGFVMNYGVAIILLTIVLRLLMWPLTRKSYTAMRAMQKMQPQLAKIQKLYAGDKARQQMEMMRIYQTHKASPMSGCLPMLLQIPIFFALYKALLISVPMRSAGFLWISDLSAMDPFFILPVLMGRTMWYQQRLQSASSSSADNNNPIRQTQKIMKWMPVIFTFMFAWMPAGLVLYWTVSNLFGILQMWIIKKSSV